MTVDDDDLLLLLTMINANICILVCNRRSVGVKVKLFLSLTKRHEDVLVSGGMAPRILDVGTRWRLLNSFTPRPLYFQGKTPRYPLDRRLGGSQSRSGRGGEEKNSRSQNAGANFLTIWVNIIFKRSLLLCGLSFIGLEEVAMQWKT
jgi:hypothetical protein